MSPTLSVLLTIALACALFPILYAAVGLCFDVICFVWDFICRAFGA